MDVIKKVRLSLTEAATKFVAVRVVWSTHKLDPSGANSRGAKAASDLL